MQESADFNFLSAKHTCEIWSQVCPWPTLLNQQFRLRRLCCISLRHDSISRVAAHAGSEAAS
jgi:hypothetical protein